MYLRHIFDEQRVRLSYGKHTPSNTCGGGFSAPDPCAPSLLSKTFIRYIANSMRLNELREHSSRRTDRFPAMTYRAAAEIALMMDKTCAGLVVGRALPFALDMRPRR